MIEGWPLAFVIGFVWWRIDIARSNRAQWERRERIRRISIARAKARMGRL